TVLSVVLLVVGIVKPEWIRIGQKQPGCPTIIAVAVCLLVISLAPMQPAGKNNAEAVKPGNVMSETLYTVSTDTRQCDSATKSGLIGASNDEKTSAGIHYMVKTP